MLTGDFETYPLSDLFQWLDQSRKAGVVELDSGGTAFWLQVSDRRVVAAARPPSATAGVQGLATWSPTGAPQALWPESCTDRIIDLFLGAEPGRFNFVAGEATHYEDGVPLELSIGQMTLEGLRRLDEWPRLDDAYGESLALQRDGSGRARTPGLNAVLEAADAGISIAETRLALGISRPALLRRIDALREQGLLQVKGATVPVDPVAALVDKAEVLVRERQFDEAGLIFRSLLATDPNDRRVRGLLREAEREQVASLYEELSPFAVPVLRAAESDLKGRRLTAVDHEVVGRINGRWDVASVALASPLREVETLKSLRKMVRLGVVDLTDPSGKSR